MRNILDTNMVLTKHQQQKSLLQHAMDIMESSMNYTYLHAADANFTPYVFKS